MKSVVGKIKIRAIVGEDRGGLKKIEWGIQKRGGAKTSPSAKTFSWPESSQGGFEVRTF